VRRIAEKGVVAKAVGVKDVRKIRVFKRFPANCPPIKRERGDNSTVQRKKEKVHLWNMGIVGIETRGTPCEDTRPTGAHGLLQAVCLHTALAAVSRFIGNFSILTLIQYKFLRCTAEYKNYIWNPKKVQCWRGDLGTEIFLFHFLSPKWNTTLFCTVPMETPNDGLGASFTRSRVQVFSKETKCTKG